MPDLTPEQIDQLARSIALHASGGTGATGHLNDFNVSTQEELVTRIKDMLADPETKFMINSSNDPGKGGSIIFFNEETKSFLAYNPNNLANPNFDEAGNIISGRHGPDNLAGTFYREPKLNEDGLPYELHRRTKEEKLLDADTELSRFNKQVRNVTNQIAKAHQLEGRNVTPEDIKVQTIAESDDWAAAIARREADIAEGIPKATERISSGEYDAPRITPDAPRPTAAEIAAETGTDAPRTDPDLRGTTELNIPAVDDTPPVTSGGIGAVDEAADAAQAATNAARAADAAEAARRAGDAANVMGAARVARTGKLGLVTTVGVTAGVAGLLTYAFSEQRGAAEAMRDAGQFSDDPAENQRIYDEYIELNESIEGNMQAENIAGQGWLFLATTPAVEYDARAQFAEFSARNNLSEEVHQGLGMSMFDGQSLRGEFAENAADLIPENMSDFPPELHGLWSAKQEMDDAQSQYDSAHRSVGSVSRYESRLSPEAREARQEARAENRAEASEGLGAAQAAYQREFSRAFSDPETSQYLLDRMPADTLIDMVEATAPYNLDSAPPLIAEMVAVQQQVDDGDSSIFYDTDAENRLEEIQAELRQNPEIAHGYIADVFGGRVDPNTIPDAPTTEVDAEATAAFTQMPEFMQNRAIETAARGVDLDGEMEGVHPYMKDLAELYQAREQGSLRTEAGNRSRANTRIDEIEEEIRNNPEIMGAAAAANPEVQGVMDAYNADPAAAEQFQAVEDTEMNSVLAHIRENAQTNGAQTFEGEDPLIRQAAELYDSRDNERRGRAAGLTNKNIDAEIRQVEEELRENPDVLSAYAQSNMGEGLVPEAAPAETEPASETDPDAPQDTGMLEDDPDRPTPNDVIDRSGEVDQILPSGANLTVQSSADDAGVVRGAVPDEQVTLTQGEDGAATLPEIEAQRQQAEQARLAEEELRRQQQSLYGAPPGQPTTPQQGQPQ